MILSDVTLGDVEGTFLYLERYVNDGSPSGFSLHNTTSPATAPSGTAPHFMITAAHLSDSVTLVKLGEGVPVCAGWDILVHPDMLAHPAVFASLSHHEPLIRVAPTASGRTVKVLGDQQPHLKLAHSGILGRIERHLTSHHALSAVEVSDVLMGAFDAGILPKALHFLPERGAHVARSAGDHPYEFGVVQRDSIPYPSDRNVALLVPCFSLFSRDIYSPDDEPLLMQLSGIQNTEPLNLLLEQILPALIEAYFETLLMCGLQLELHAQNTLLALDSNLNTCGIVVRDLESVDKDLSLIEELDLNVNFTSFNYKCLRNGDYNYSIAHSYMYDFKLGEYLLGPLISIACTKSSWSFADVAKEVRRLTRPYLERLPRDFFPKDWFSYPNQVVDRSRPRPYVNHGTPLFRQIPE